MPLLGVPHPAPPTARAGRPGHAPTLPCPARCAPPRPRQEAGLFPEQYDMNTGAARSSIVSTGAYHDSFYEYLLKARRLGEGRVPCAARTRPRQRQML